MRQPSKRPEAPLPEEQLFEGLTIGFALTGSFCTFKKVFSIIPELTRRGAELQPILSDNAYQLDTRFYTAQQVQEMMFSLCGREIWHTLPQVEPIGPRKLLDLLIVAPCTGNTVSKLASGIVDTPVAMAVKSQLRNGRPVLLAVSTNDGLAGCAASIGRLLTMRHMFFVPFGQDDPTAKPSSLVAHMELIPESAAHALCARQLQPMLRPY